QRSICGAAAEFAVEATIGARWGVPFEDVVHSRLVILWGHNPVSTAPHFMPFLLEARRRGCYVVVIDPLRNKTAAHADLHLAPLAGTDGHLAMGVAHLLLRDGRHDESWLNDHAVGWPEFRARLAAYTPEAVAASCGLTVDAVVELARLYGSRRPGLIR